MGRISNLGGNVLVVAILSSAGAYGLTDKPGFPIIVDLDKGRPVESSPSMGDINGDGRDEIVVGCRDGKVYAYDGRGQLLPGWPVSTGDTIASSPAIGDIDGDKRDEIIIGSDDGKVYALEGSGSIIPGWPVDTGGAVRSTACVADINGDMKDDIIIGSSAGKVFAFSGNGLDISGWPVNVGAGVDSSPAVADVDGDDLPEVAVGCDDGNVYLIDNDGKIVPGWPVETRYYVRSSPAIGDIDNDGSLEIVVGSDDFNVYAWNANGTLCPGWPVATEYKLSLASPALVDLDADKKLDVVVGSGDNILYAWDGAGVPLTGWPVTTSGRLYNSSPAVIDVDGDSTLDIVVGGEDTQLYVFDGGGRQIEGSPIPLTGPVHSSPAAGDVDGDGLLELAVGDGAGSLYCWDLRGAATLNRGARWSEFHQSHWKAGVYGYVGGASQLPKCVVTKMEGEYAGAINITYTLSDPQLDTLDLKVMVSDDWGHTWREATVTGMTSSLGPNRYQGTLVWDSEVDLKGPLERDGERDLEALADEWREYREQKDVKLKIIPVDPNGLGTAGETTLLHVDNNEPPTVSLKPVTEEVSGDVYVDYDITDAEHDLIAFKAQYSLDGGTTWKDATVDGAVVDIRSSRYKGNLVWESDKNIKGVDRDDIIFQLIPTDNDAGQPGVISKLHVDNNRLPAVTVTDVEEEVTNDVKIDYAVTDEESDTVSLNCEFSLDGGQTWKVATVSGAAANISSAGYAGSLTWNSRPDTVGVDKTSVQFRVTPTDNDPGKADATGSFHLDNNDPPTVAITPVEGEQSGPVQVVFDISDPEGDAVTLVPEYFDEQDQKWKIASVQGGITDIEPARYTSSLIWDSYVDMLGISNKQTKFRITAFDNDQGLPVEGRPIDVDNNSPPTVLVNDITAEQEQDITVTYTLSDLERDPISFKCEYSEDGGVTWKAASVSGPAASISVEDYVGEIVWHSGKDSLNKHLSQARFRIIPSDEDEGKPGSTSDFTVDNNNPPRAEVIPSGKEETGTFAVRYQLEDDERDALAISCDYSTDGGQTWTPGTISGTADGIGPGSYDNSISWDSAADIPGVDQENILFRVTPADLDAGVPAISPPLHVDNSAPPSVSMATPEGEQWGDIVMEFTLEDAENDVLNVKAEFSEDGGSSWEPATVDGQLTDIYSSGYLGSVVWRSQTDLPGTDQTDIAFRIVPNDNDAGAPGKTENFHLDNNEIPTISVETPAGEQSDRVEIRYSLQDPESDASFIKTEYSIDDGFTWHDATVATTTKMDPTKYAGVIIWDSKTDLGDVDREDVRFRVTPFDNDEGVSDVTDAFHLDNNTAPAVALPPLTAKESGDVEVAYAVSDADSSDVNLRAEYSLDGGKTWTEATVASGMDNLGPGDYQGNFVWNSFADLPGVDSADVLLRVTPSDNDAGVAGTVEKVHVDNNDPPSVAVTDIFDEQTGDVTLEYNVSDAENDDVTLEFEYSADGGSSWKKPTLASPAVKVSSSGYTGVVTWRSAADVKGLDREDILVRVRPADNDAGESYVSSPFHVDDNDPPTVAVSPPEDTGRDQVTINYRLADAENDAVNLSCEYSVDGGATWSEAAVSGNLEGISSAGYAGSLTWSARDDIGGTDSSQTLFRVTPSDKDAGQPVTSRGFRVDVNNPPRVTLREIADKQGDEIPVDYELADDEGDDLSVKCEYSTDGGVSWKVATVSGDTSAISSVTYANTVIWNARRDLGAVDSKTMAFRITPSDADVGTAGDVKGIHVDTNRAPAVTISAGTPDAAGDVQVSYTVSDEEGDAVDLVVEYSADGGFTFNPASVSPALSRLPSGQYRGTFTWLAAKDAVGQDLTDAAIRVTPKDNDEGEPVISAAFRVDNNHVPSVTLKPFVGEKLGVEVEVDYVIADDEGDRVSILAEYSSDNGVSWKNATVFGLTSDILPNAYDGALVWSVASDIAGQELKNVSFRVTPSDGETGKPAALSGLFVDTNRPPQVVVGDVIAEQEEAAVKIDYSVMDDEGNAVTLKCEYSADNGSTWKPATVSSRITGLSGSDYFGTLTWEAARDLGAGVEKDVIFRITPSDADAGETSQNRPFRVDLNEAPTVTLAAYKELEDGSVKVEYAVRDAENNNVRVDVEYSEDGGASWFPASVDGELDPITPARYSGSFTWRRMKDVPTVLPGSAIKLRGVPFDEDEGLAGELKIDIKPTGE